MITDYKNIYGYRLIPTNVITKQVPIRPHKKKRINKKWLKRYGTKTVPDYGKIVVFDHYIFAQPETIKRIEESL